MDRMILTRLGLLALVLALPPVAFADDPDPARPTMVYDAAGNPVSSDEGRVLTQYLRDREGKILEVRDSNGAVIRYGADGEQQVSSAPPLQ